MYIERKRGMARTTMSLKEIKMKHSITELYRIEGYKGLYTKEYLECEQIQILKRIGKHTFGKAQQCQYIVNAKGVATLHEPLSERTIYLYGEKTWFDTQEERDAYKAECEQTFITKRERIQLTNQLLSKIEHYTNEQLIQLIQQI